LARSGEDAGSLHTAKLDGVTQADPPTSHFRYRLQQDHEEEEDVNNEHIQRIIKEMADSLEGSTDFVLAQAPEVIQQLILLKRIECPLFLCISVVMLALMTWGAYHSTQKLREALDEQDDGPIILWIIASVCTVFSGGVLTLVTIDHISNTLTVWFAPKVYILEYAANLLR
jgi:hypothetical protein